MDPPVDTTRIFEGSIKSFNQDKGWGHIDCAETRKLYGKDIFLLRSQLNGAEVGPGDLVTFTIRKGRSGVEATNVKVRGGGCGGDSDGRQMCADFKKGSCERGDKCRYSHIDGGCSPGGYGAMPFMGYGPYGAMPPHGCGMPGPYGMPVFGAPCGYGAPAPCGMYAAPVPLPMGWEQAADPATGRPYFFNRMTNETSWTPPAAPAPAPGVGGYGAPEFVGGGSTLPAGWEQTTDPASGRTYFFNRATGATSWTPPT